MSIQRKLYLFAALCFAIGTVLSVVASSWGSFVIFLLLTASMLWIQWRVDVLIDQRRPNRDDR